MAARIKLTGRAGGLSWTGRTYLRLLLIFFFIGAVVGFLVVCLGGEKDELRRCLEDYFSLVRQNGLSVSFASCVWDCFHWPVLVTALGFTALGVFAIPVAFAFRGFLLAYSATCFAVLFGYGGLTAAAVLLSASALLVLPVLFVLGCDGFMASRARLPGAALGETRYFRPEIILIGAGILLIAAALQAAVIPALFSAVCGRLAA